MIVNYVDLKNIFTHDLTIRSISERHKTCSEGEVESFSESSGFDSILFINADGKYMVYDSWKEDKRHFLEHEDVVSDSTPLIEAFNLIVKWRRVFVKTGSSIDRIATISDLNKLPFRIWMFGVISILELVLREIIDLTCQNNWSNSLSPKRLEMANKLYLEKKHDNEDISLLECIQLKDLCTIISKNQELKSSLKIDISQTKFENIFDSINLIRDELAHSNKSFSLNWKIILESLKFAEELIEKSNTASNINYPPTASLAL